MNLNDVRVFLTASTTKSLTQAAKQLEISTMAASRRLSSLEEELGVRLLHRTTRSLSLTPEGDEFLPYAQAMIEAQEHARHLFSPATTGAQGLLRITAPSGLGRRNIIPLIPTLVAGNPQLRVDLHLHDDVVDIVGRGIDVAIRVAPLKDSNLIAKKIISNPRMICAAPSYISEFGAPQVVRDLPSHNCIKLSAIPQWTFMENGQTVSLTVEGRTSCSNVEGVRELCIAGMGLAQLTLLDIAQELESGKLVAVNLDDVTPQELSVWAVLPTNKHIPRRVGVFIESLKSALSTGYDAQL